MTHGRLIKYSNKKSILSSSQFGFHSTYFTTHVITFIHERVLENVDNDEHSISIFLDISNAFVSVNYKILLNKLGHYSIRGICAHFYSAGNPQPPRYDINNLFYSDVPNCMFYALLLEFWKILRNGSLKRFGMNDFDVNCDS